MLFVSGRWPKSSAHDVIRFSASIGRVGRFVHIARLMMMTHAKSIKSDVESLHEARWWASRQLVSCFADCFWIKNGASVGVCSLVLLQRRCASEVQGIRYTCTELVPWPQRRRFFLLNVRFFVNPIPQRQIQGWVLNIAFTVGAASFSKKRASIWHLTCLIGRVST
jgi:hypothetical protein